MFDIGFTELLLIGVVALLVLGPERLPRAAKLAGLWLRRARASWFSLRSELERELADDELRRSLKDSAEQLREVKRELAESERDIGRALPGSTAVSASSAQPSAVENSANADASSDPVVKGDAEAVSSSDSPGADVTRSRP